MHILGLPLILGLGALSWMPYRNNTQRNYLIGQTKQALDRSGTLADGIYAKLPNRSPPNYRKF